MNLESVLGESLQHYGIKRSVPLTNRTGSTMNVNFEVIDTKRGLLSVHKGCGNGSMIVFTPDGKGKIVNDTKCIDQVKQIMAKNFGLLVVDISVAFMHARKGEEIYVKVPSGIKSSRFWRLKAAVNGTKKASKHWQEFSCDKLVTNMLFQQNDIDPCTYTRFCDIWTWNSTATIFWCVDHLVVQTMWVQQLNKIGLISLNKYFVERGRFADETRSKSSTRQAGKNDGLHISR